MPSSATARCCGKTTLARRRQRCAATWRKSSVPARCCWASSTTSWICPRSRPAARRSKRRPSMSPRCCRTFRTRSSRWHGYRAMCSKSTAPSMPAWLSSQMLRQDYIGAEQAEMCGDLEKIERSGQMLLGIIDDILDLSKIEAGRETVKAQTFDVAAVLQDVSNAVQPLARLQGNVLEIDCPEHARMAYADLSKFRQSVLNLVNNALKFTERGCVSVAVNKLRNGDGEWTEVHVSDTGIGIGREHLGKLFQPFSQVDGSATRKYNGTGLGLAISKKFCQMMGGDITVESEPGRGSRFSIRVPAGRDVGQASACQRSQRSGDGV